VNINRIGKNILYFSVAIFAGLFISLQILEAHAPEQARIDKISNSGMYEERNLNFVQNVKDKIADLFVDSDSMLLSLRNKDVQAALAQCKRKGKPIAILAYNNNFLVDEKGRVLSIVNSSAHFDLPVITGSDIQADIRTCKLYGKLLREALQFLSLLKKYNRIAYYQVSELHLSPQIGLVVNLGAPYYIPILIGRDSIGRKVLTFSRFMEEYGKVDILSHIKYADFRIDGQIILKKNS